MITNKRPLNISMKIKNYYSVKIGCAIFLTHPISFNFCFYINYPL